MTEEAIFLLAVAAAVLVFGIGWYASRRLALGWRLAARAILLVAVLAPLGVLLLREAPRQMAERRPSPSSDAQRKSFGAGKAGAPAAPETTPSPAPPSSPPVDLPKVGAAPPPAVEKAEATRPMSRSVELNKTADKASELWDVVRVFFGTDRKRGTDNKRLTYSSDRAGRLELGRADITVPKSHQVPNIERPFALRVPFTSITLYEASEDPAKHFTVRDIRDLTEAQFLDEVRAKLAASTTFKNRALVFVHGYNTDFDFAIYRTAQLAYDLKFDGAPFLYSWPSSSGITGYISDRDSAEQAEPYLRAFLDLVIRETGATNVSLIAHSMGNLPLLRVLRDLAPKLPASVQVDQVILAAPDVDRTLFEQWAVDIAKIGRGVTLYASSKDRAMTAARLVTGGTPRAGDIPADGPVIVSGIDTIDVSSTTMDTLTLGHSLYAERDALVTDIAALLQTGLRPPDKRMPTLQRVETQRGLYWRVP